MVQRDYIGPARKVSKTGIIEIKDLIKWIRKWISEKGYMEILEKSYDEKGTSEGKKTYMHWECAKKVETYVKCVIEIRLDALTNDVAVTSGNRKITAQEGDISVEFQGYLKKDTAGEWKLEAERPWRRVLKELYNKFILSDKFADYENTLKSDVSSLINSTKGYFGVRKFD